MSIENAKDFMKYLVSNEDLREKFRGFTMEELKTATEELKRDPDPELADASRYRDCPNKFDI